MCEGTARLIDSLFLNANNTLDRLICLYQLKLSIEICRLYECVLHVLFFAYHNHLFFGFAKYVYICDQDYSMACWTLLAFFVDIVAVVVVCVFQWVEVLINHRCKDWNIQTMCAGFIWCRLNLNVWMCVCFFSLSLFVSNIVRWLSLFVPPFFLHKVQGELLKRMDTSMCFFFYYVKLPNDVKGPTACANIQLPQQFETVFFSSSFIQFTIQYTSNFMC